jgi:hypothetical protein
MLRINSERSIALMPFSKAQNAVFVFDGFDKLKFDSAQLFIENIRKTNQNFKGVMLFYLDEKAPKLIKGEAEIKALHPEFDLGFVYAIHKNEFGIGSKIKNEGINELLSSHFDILISTDNQLNPMFEGIFVQLSAKMKIGINNKFNTEFCDVIVEQKEQDNTMDRFVLMSKYVEMLG